MIKVADKMTSALGELMGGDLMDVLTGCFERMDWAEDEIARAQKRHPESADAIYHSFKLLNSADSKGFERMGVELVYRSHCRELLERVAAGQDTRPGTAAEVAIACCEASLLSPLTTTAAGLYCRMWAIAFPGHSDVWAGQGEHYEGLRGTQIDDLEREARHKTASAGRRRGDIECGGMHHGETVACKYAKAVQLAMTDAA
jgi:hypothetical protein